MPTPTPAQNACIQQRGNVLVVASAGTGKTSTLVQRCRHLLLHENCSLDEILMVTFTEAAAREMRGRIREELLELQAAPENPAQAEHVEKQLSLLDTAQICTLHSFCLDLVRQHFYQLGIAPSVMVLDEKQTGPLATQVLDALLEAAYGGTSPEDLAVQELVKLAGRGSDGVVRQLILKLHRFRQVLPDGDAWAAEQIKMFEEAKSAAWLEWLCEEFEPWRQFWVRQLESCTDSVPAVTEAAYLLKELEENISLRISKRAAQLAAGLKRLSTALESDDNWPHGSKKRVRDKLLKNFVADVNFLHAALGDPDEKLAPLRHDWDCVRAPMRTLLELTRRFDEAFSRAKRELGGVDFPDLERLALQLLREPSIARACQERYRYIFVDEYQDINRVQDAILALLSRQGAEANRFLVGDVKQSIYGFRLADPKIFLEYEEAWRADSEQGKRIPLSDNFRSRECILDFVNALIPALMRPSVGGITYSPDVHLQFGAREQRVALGRGTEPAGARVQVHLVDEKSEQNASPEGSEELVDLRQIEREARLAASLLRKLKQEKHLVWDMEKKAPRAAEWRDMVVLLRSPAGRVETFAQEFHRMGVPLSAARSGFLQSIEVTDLLCMFKLLDNPMQDIPLLAVLRSPLAGMTLDELAEIRAHNKERPLWVCLNKFSRAATRPKEKFQPGQESLIKKVDCFLKAFGAWRDMARQASLSDCLERILLETHYPELLAALPRGEERVANVRRLLELVREYDPWQRQGLYRFLRFVRLQEEAEVELEPASAQTEDAVRLMSIHKAKGLEFPIVVLAGLGTRFNMQDLSGEVLLHEKFGLCPRVHSPQTALSYPSLAHWLARRELERKAIGEELRLLYVALTRARDTLILTGSGKAPAWKEQQPAAVDDQDLLRASSYLKMLALWLPQVTKEKDWTGEREGQNELFSWRIYPVDDGIFANTTKVEQSGNAAAGQQMDGELWSKLQPRMDFVYPCAAATTEPAIKRISEVIWTGSEADETVALPWPKRRQAHSGRTGQLTLDLGSGETSASRGRSGKLRAAQVGDAHHRFLEIVALEDARNLERLQQAGKEMVECGDLSAEELEALDLGAIHSFWNSEVGRSILQQPGRNVHRELPFTVCLTPEDLGKLNLCPNACELRGERFIGRGKVDLAVILAAEIWIVDFKTDRVKAGELPGANSPYGCQLNLYALALERIYRRPATRKWLHFLVVRKSVSV